MPVRYDDDARTLTVGISELLEIGRTEGDLSEGVAARARLREGCEVHARYQDQRRGEDEGFRAEVAVRLVVEVEGWACVVLGRIDGLSRRGDGTLVVEEVKSVALPREALERLVAEHLPRYRRQLLLYLHFLGASGESPVAGRLVLVGAVDGGVRTLPVAAAPEETLGWLRAVLGRLVRERAAEVARRASARGRVPDFPFVHAEFRVGQREIAEGVEAAVRGGRRLLLSAPTGAGKTAATLHGALRAAFDLGLRIDWLTARNPQQAGVLEHLARLHGKVPELRAVGIRSKERICPQPRVLCRANCCEFARDHYGKMFRVEPLPPLLARGPATPDDLLEAALHAQVCPFELTLEAADRVDVVVCDYNYVFDGRVALRRFADPDPGDRVLVVDEAHQLPERIMDGLSPEIREDAIAAAREAALSGLAGAPSPLLRLFDELQDEVEEWDRLAPPRGEGPFPVELARDRFESLRQGFEEVLADRDLYLRLRPATALPDGDRVLALYREVRRFADTLAMDPASFRHLFGRGRQGRWLKVLCVDPSAAGARIAGYRAAVLLSATLEPMDYYRRVLGLPEEVTDEARHPSPFPPENRRVIVRGDVSTLYRDRTRTAPAVGAAIDDALGLDPRAWLVYFPSFEYRDLVAPHVGAAGRAVLRQGPRMDDGERTALLDRLSAPDAPGPVLLGVLGGIFAEGIDLPGARIGGVVVVSPALPRYGVERELLREHLQGRFGRGFEYAYLYPGMSRVVQAAGRVIRGPEDRATVVLLCRRFAERRALELLPADWQVQVRG
ncbi:ATP-dependent DNA helicase [Myxococcota bacterium]|nr:ATP-dependent DNA helicase [Myxococcota bacterium]